ncbi:MAG TPA: 2-amino-4-hydroxy-6-hydroxymethyldihydropteridine diphosphokinase [Acidimicrobiia bacterium]|nr:2-amino-4-hydroxy-6-hydroxymethyldihydropteridine diphosphokinase [Acidimicrobiia bacterium]
MSRLAHLGIGSNLGDRLAHLQGAVDDLASAADVDVVAVSSVYETSPVGGPEQDDYLNAVVAVETERSARSLLELGQELERRAQRIRNVRWGPRTLDVDVLLIGSERTTEADLEVPHPRIWDRGFVVVPLHEIAPDLVRADRLAAVAEDDVRRTDLSLTIPT